MASAVLGPCPISGISTRTVIRLSAVMRIQAFGLKASSCMELDACAADRSGTKNPITSAVPLEMPDLMKSLLLAMLFMSITLLPGPRGGWRAECADRFRSGRCFPTWIDRFLHPRDGRSRQAAPQQT